MDEVINTLEKDHKFSTLHVYRYALKTLRSFIKIEKCWERLLDEGLVKEFEMHLAKRSLSLGTSATYMRMLRGMPFSDLAHLRKCDYKDEAITYCRYKTKRWMTIKVPEDARILIRTLRQYGPRESLPTSATEQRAKD